jgi:hypothetical protein
MGRDFFHLFGQPVFYRVCTSGKKTIGPQAYSEYPIQILETLALQLSVIHIYHSSYSG